MLKVGSSVIGSRYHMLVAGLSLGYSFHWIVAISTILLQLDLPFALLVAIVQWLAKWKE